MSFYFREKPRFGDKLRGNKSRDELMQEFKQQFDDNSKSFFEPATTRVTRDPFERHTGFSRGFPFDDVEGFGRRGSDIRSHLDDLASRHPEFADHLLGSAWGDIPAFHNTGSLRNRRRRGSGSSSSYQGHPDEDARSQTSGSSGNSAASGASGVSSHGEPSNSTYNNENHKESSTKQQKVPTTRRNPIPQYGLRNTVDIGQHRHEMDNPEKPIDNRGQRSMSAPPENRQQNDIPQFIQQESQQQQNPANQRFVSRVDITPQFVQPPSVEKVTTATKAQQQPAHQQSPQQQKTSQQQQSNVRHIPIFVEGRDEPVVPKNVETDQTDNSSWSYAKPQSTTLPPQFQQTPQFPTPPQFHRPSHFNQHYTGRAKDWLPSFEEEFYNPQASFQQPGVRRTHQQQPPFAAHSPPRHGSHFRQAQAENNSRAQPQRQQNENNYFPQQSHPQHSTPPQQQQQQQQQQQEIPVETPRKQTQPKDPLEKVAEVQKEVDSLNEQVMLWNGKSRKDKDYMYLDEMLTRELIKLDDIETEGKENVRQARKNAIKSIQDSISLLELKAPLNDQSGTAQPMEVQQEIPEIVREEENPEAGMKNDEKPEINTENGTNEQQAPIPLPPAPSSPTKEPISNLPEIQDTTQQPQNETVDETSSASQEIAEATIDVTPVTKVSSVGSMEIQAVPEIQEKPEVEVKQTDPETLMDVEVTKSPKTAKKIRKTKKQQQQQQKPICNDPIPLPAPEHQNNLAN